jgi:hypothetical protein
MEQAELSPNVRKRLFSCGQYNSDEEGLQEVGAFTIPFLVVARPVGTSSYSRAVRC